MFDELKDPYPPQVTEVHIVSVIARAHRIRHRQRMAVFATTATFAAGVGGVAWMARSTQSSTLTAGAPIETPIATLVATTFAIPSTTIAVPTTNPAEQYSVTTATAVTEAAVVESSPEIPTTDAIQPAAPPSTFGQSPAPEETTVPTTPMPSKLVAVKANGDVVLVKTTSGKAGAALVKAAAAAPSAEGQPPGEFKAGGLSPDGQNVYYADCCTSNNVHEFNLATSQSRMVGVGRRPRVSPDGAFVAVTDKTTVTVYAPAAESAVEPTTVPALPTSDAATTTQPIDGAAAVTAPSSSTVDVPVPSTAARQVETWDVVSSLSAASVSLPSDVVWMSNGNLAVLEVTNGSWSVSERDPRALDTVFHQVAVPARAAQGGPESIDVFFVGLWPAGGGLLLAATPADESAGFGSLIWVRSDWSNVAVVSQLVGKFNSIVADPSGNHLAEVDGEGTLRIVSIDGKLEKTISGTFKTASW